MGSESIIRAKRPLCYRLLMREEWIMRYQCGLEDQEQDRLLLVEE